VLFETPGCGSGPEDQPSHEPRWHGDAAAFDEAAPVPITSGDIVTDVDGVLDPRPPLGLREGVVGQVGRVAGSDRVATAIEIARRASADQGADTVVVARADQYADAIVAGPLAAKLGAPILLSGGERLDERVSALMAELVPSTAYLLGGEAALSPRVEARPGAAHRRPRRPGPGLRGCDTRARRRQSHRLRRSTPRPPFRPALGDLPVAPNR